MLSDGLSHSRISRGCTLEISITRLKHQIAGPLDFGETVHITGMSSKVLSVRTSASSRGLLGASALVDKDIITARTGRNCLDDDEETTATVSQLEAVSFYCKVGSVV